MVKAVKLLQEEVAVEENILLNRNTFFMEKKKQKWTKKPRDGHVTSN